MKLLVWLSVVLLPLGVQAFVVAPDTLVSQSQYYQIESWEGQMQVTLTQTWENPTQDTESLALFLPLAGSGTPQVFWNAAGLAVMELDEARAASRSFELAAAADTPALLGALDTPWQTWWQSESWDLGAGETGVLKYVYTIPLSTTVDWFVGTVFLADDRSTQDFKIELVRAGSPQHFWASLGSWSSERGPEAWAYLWETTDYQANEPLQFFVSEEAAPTLGYNYEALHYEAQFEALMPPNRSRVVMLLDHSGSVYGARWERLQEAADTLLKAMPETTQIKLGLASDELTWLDNDWTVNSREHQQTWDETLAGTNVQGKSNWEAVMSELELLAQNSDERVALVWLGDFSDFPTEARQRLAQWPWRVMMVDFYQTQSSYLADWWPRFGGRYVALFNSGYELVEAELLSRSWQRLGLQWPGSQQLHFARETFPPRILTDFANQWAVTQTMVGAELNMGASFVPRWWAARKLADYLRQSLGRDLTDDEWLAMASIDDVFGVGLFGQMQPPSVADIQAALAQQDQDAVWKEILRLESVDLANDSVRFWGAEPFYPEADQWQTRRWNTFAKRGESLKLEPWSAAHETLFLSAPRLFARPFSWGSVSLCAGQRCAAVVPGGRTESQPTDVWLWQNEGTQHWATNYWADLVWAGVIETPVLDFEVWSQGVSRGQFVEWLVTQLWPEAILPTADGSIFPDVTSDQTGASQALYLHELGLFKGYSDGQARLSAPLKRIEALKLLMTAHGMDIRDVIGNYDTKAPLSDLVGWTQPWGMEAYNRGLVKGYEDGTFRPFQELTQAEAFKLLVEAPRVLSTEN